MSMDQRIVQQYINFVGKAEVEELTKKFNVQQFCRRWEQVLTSRSTGLLGSGIVYSSVNAIYVPLLNNEVGVLNSAFDGKFQKTSIIGASRARDANVPTCRTVKFGTQLIEGNYWLIYISDNFDTLIVSAPIIIPGLGINLSNNFGLYVLVQNRDKFWSSEEPNKVFDVLKKYGFTQFWNNPVNSGSSFPIFREDIVKLIEENKEKRVKKQYKSSNKQQTKSK